jgi:hypothetical protein
MGLSWKTKWDKCPTYGKAGPLYKESNLLIFGTAQVSARKREKKERRERKKGGRKEGKERKRKRRKEEEKEERKIGGLQGNNIFMVSLV